VNLCIILVDRGITDFENPCVTPYSSLLLSSNVDFSK
jgi:hypothetical protein